jgi:hypothetical protein
MHEGREGGFASAEPHVCRRRCSCCRRRCRLRLCLLLLLLLGNRFHRLAVPCRAPILLLRAWQIGVQIHRSAAVSSPRAPPQGQPDRGHKGQVVRARSAKYVPCCRFPYKFHVPCTSAPRTSGNPKPSSGEDLPHRRPVRAEVFERPIDIRHRNHQTQPFEAAPADQDWLFFGQK